MTDPNDRDQDRSGERSHQGRTVHKEIMIRARPDEVWQAWAKPDQIARWFVDRAQGEAKPGEIMTWCFDTMKMELPVPIVEAVPGKSFVAAGEVPGRPPFLLEVLIEDAGGGKTRLFLANSGFGDGAEWDDEYEGVDSGWELALTTLKHVLETRAENRVHVFTLRPARLEYEDLAPFYTTASGLSSWIAGGGTRIDGEPIRKGSTVSLQGDSPLPLTGEVVARSRREVLLRWKERDALLGLKAFSMGPAGRAIGLDYNAWPAGDPPADTTAVREWMEQALDRLLAVLPATTPG